MSSRMQATALNNHAVSLMQRGSLWQALETCQSAIACLDDDQPLLNHCCCRFLAGPLNTYMCTCTLSILANRNRCMGETARQFLFEGNQSHVSGYEWVDCQPKEVHENASKIMKSTHSLIQAPEYNLTHDTRLAFLSLGAIKIFRDHTSEENLRHHVSCDCALRWAIYHKYV